MIKPPTCRKDTFKISIQNIAGHLAPSGPLRMPLHCGQPSFVKVQQFCGMEPSAWRLGSTRDGIITTSSPLKWSWQVVVLHRVTPVTGLSDAPSMSVWSRMPPLDIDQLARWPNKMPSIKICTRRASWIVARQFGLPFIKELVSNCLLQPVRAYPLGLRTMVQIDHPMTRCR